MRHLPRCAAPCISLALAALGAAVALPSQAVARRSLAPIGPAPHPLRGARDAGAAPDATTLSLTVTLEPRDPAALRRAADAVSDPRSPSYRQYLPAGRFAQEFGPAPATIAAVRAELRAAGLTVGPTSRNGLQIPVTTTVAGAETAFGTPIHRYRLASGRIAVANTQAPTLATDVAEHVQAVVGLDTRAHSRPLLRRAAPTAPATGARAAGAGGKRPRATTATAAPSPCPAATQVAQYYGGYTADRIARAYGLDGLMTTSAAAAGTTVALYELQPYLPSDIAAYQACYGTTASVTNVNVNGGPGKLSAGSEATLDIETLVGLAPAADVLVYQAKNTTANALAVLTKIADDDRAQVVSSSWGACEADVGPSQLEAENTIFEQMAVQGQTFVAAGGDSGSTDCAGADPSNLSLSVDDPGSQPYATGVGGTDLTAIGAPPQTPPTETTWNAGVWQHVPAGGGGGISNYWPMPAYQSAPGVSNDFTSPAPCGAPPGSACREVPDVSASAAPAHPYVVVIGGQWQAVGGTSAASPAWAAFVALTDASPSCAGTSVGFLNPALYLLASNARGDFNDVTTGTNDAAGLPSGAYPATAGYDLATGLGTPYGPALAADLCALATGTTLPPRDPGTTNPPPGGTSPPPSGGSGSPPPPPAGTGGTSPGSGTTAPPVVTAPGPAPTTTAPSATGPATSASTSPTIVGAVQVDARLTRVGATIHCAAVTPCQGRLALSVATPSAGHARHAAHTRHAVPARHAAHPRHAAHTRHAVPARHATHPRRRARASHATGAGAGARARAHARATTLGSRSFAIPARGTATIPVTTSRRGRRALRRWQSRFAAAHRSGRRLTVTLRTTARAGAAPAQVATNRRRLLIPFATAWLRTHRATLARGSDRAIAKLGCAVAGAAAGPTARPGTAATTPSVASARARAATCNATIVLTSGGHAATTHLRLRHARQTARLRLPASAVATLRRDRAAALAIRIRVRQPGHRTTTTQQARLLVIRGPAA